MSVEIKDFNSKQALGLVRVLEKTDENVVVAYKQWDMEKAKFGELVEKTEEVAVQNIKELQDRKRYRNKSHLIEIALDILKNQKK